MAATFVCDFDGTVAPADIGARLVERFTPPGVRELGDALARWRDGSLGHRELTEIECRHLDLSAAEAEAFARDFEVDPEFPAFVRWVEDRGDRVEIVSEGFGFYIVSALERAGLSDVPWSANRLRFEGHRAWPEFPQQASSCGRCGNCKGARVRELQAYDRWVVFVGDGTSDRCGAKAANRVFAKDALWEWCRSSGLPAEPFLGFADLASRCDRTDPVERQAGEDFRRALGRGA
jgi:2-hydroxy-3-keto-5-methylthiopentenyl-1-phosphate phosphatase